MISRSCLLALAAAALLAAPAAADTPTLLGVSKNWTAATSGAGDAKVCFAMAHPTSSLPKKAKRGPIGFLVNAWPTRKTGDQPQVVAGYKYKDASTVTAKIGADTFTFFTRNDADDGQAWIKDPADEVRLIDAMKHGSTMVVSGTSQRGTVTTDTYSLAGISDALDKVHTCGA